MASAVRYVKQGVVFLLLISLAKTFAVEPNVSADKLRTEAARRLIESMDIAVAAPAATLAIITSLKKKLLQDYPNRGSALKAAIKHAYNKMTSRRNELEELLVPIYARSLTTEDMDKLADFYRSNLGKRFLAAQPAMLKGTTAATSAWAKEIRAEAAADIRSQMQKK